MPDKPRIALTLGDPAGVGPELAAKLLAEPATAELADLRVIASVDEFARATEQAQVEVPVTAATESGSVILIDPQRTAPLPTGTAATSAEAGRWALDGLRFALDLATSGEVDGICFTPLNKTSLHLAGMTEEDELRWFANTLGHQGRTSEFNVLDALWTGRVTSHISLAEVPELITADAVAETVALLDRALRDSGVDQPRIAVAALNPHAGENGHFGRQEIDEIAPGVLRARAAGATVDGPFPSDTVFLKAKAGLYDGVVTMYHDQGQIAMKLIGFDRGVTVQGGLPVPITTPAHGTAFDIVGTNSADLGATRNAFGLAVKLARQQIARSAA
ncbi:4-hydroxythreonine-4-phosphate dehydrogenase PdxA [Microlunatus soli]|uniref:4-hydroxythreonine-4-phosphate dehydrogenase n=1 Tax=Microlunatus soli TaxID=630515 RepID=A0A1H1VKD4_9ACTN|nr:4-hydroxythreonine-4-phosphate dehydrogenase PdxA [Microlunatus soli]SDS84980.1 4-hydroxythreonine-4-phosphate dehydrogenase [Microlunatus soli]